MREHGIIMSAPMVLALLSGRKTVTRRTKDRWSDSAPRYATPRAAYLALFREINGDAMPDHLWRIEFRRVG